MKKIKCIVIDDDPLITDLITHFTDKAEEIDYCVTSNDSIAGLKLLSNGAFDLLFLDLNMPALNGKNILDLKQDKSKVIMVTSDQEFAAESYRYEDVVDYLVKPIKYDRFVEGVKRCQQIMQKEVELPSPDSDSKQIMVKEGNKWIPINLDTILFIKSDSNYCIISCRDKSIMTLVNLKVLLTKLPSHFIQCHRSYIVNMQNIDHFTKEEIALGDHVIPISNKQKSLVFNFMNADL